MPYYTTEGSIRIICRETKNETNLYPDVSVAGCGPRAW